MQPQSFYKCVVVPASPARVWSEINLDLPGEGPTGMFPAWSAAASCRVLQHLKGRKICLNQKWGTLTSLRGSVCQHGMAFGAVVSPLHLPSSQHSERQPFPPTFWELILPQNNIFDFLFKLKLNIFCSKRKGGLSVR